LLKSINFTPYFFATLAIPDHLYPFNVSEPNSFTGGSLDLPDLVC